jgi:tetratricopeptide (TPR) repeat protein
MKPRASIRRVGVHAACLIASLMFLAGCEGKFSRLLTRHFSNDQQDQAKQRWETVRGGVKLQIAEQHLKAGRLPEAEKVLEQALAMKTDGAKSYLLLTRLRIEQGRLSEAREAIEQATSFVPTDPEVFYLSGAIEERYGNMDEALSQYTTAAANAPESVDYVMAQAEAMVSLGRLIDALELIESRVADFDGHAPIHVLAAKVNLMLGLRGPAVEHARQAVGLSPDDVRLVADAGWILVWADECREAVGVLEPLIVEDHSSKTTEAGVIRKPKSVPPSVRHSLARAYLSCGQTRDAQRVLRPLLNDRERDGLAWQLYGRAALAAGDLEMASSSLGMARRFGVESAETWLLAANVAFQMKDYQASREAAIKSLELNPGDQAGYWMRGLAEQAMGRVDEAREAFRQASRMDGDATISARLLISLKDSPDDPAAMNRAMSKTREAEQISP